MTTPTFVLIMEDIHEAVQGDQIAGGTLDNAHLAARVAAKLHGPTINHPALADLTWTDAPNPQAWDDRAALYRLLLPGFLDRYAGRLGTEVLEIGRWLAEHNRQRLASNEGPQSLVHGDYRLDNMLFGPDGTLVVVDWQTVSIGSGAADLAYFVGAGLLPATRRESEAAIFATYCDGLKAYHEVDRDVLWHDYVLGSASGYAMAVIASQLVGQTERGDEMFAVMAERHAAQMIDLGLADLLG
ncbi:MAG: phosphotransferase [Acidimicrobiales bacterium]